MYIDMVDEFIKEKIVGGMIKLRKKYDMYEAEEFEEELEDMDMSMGASGKSSSLVLSSLRFSSLMGA